MNKNNFIQISNKIYNAVITIDLTQNQIKIILLLLRLTYGCNKEEAYVRIKAYFEAIGISSSHIKEPLEALIKNKILLIRNDKFYKLNINKLFELGKLDVNANIRLNDLIHENLSQKGNVNLPDKEIELLPKKERSYSQKGNTNEQYLTQYKQNSAPKDSIKDSIKDSVNTDNAVNKNYIDPKGFYPMNEEEVCAMECWKAIEPNNPRFFEVYLKFSKAVPVSVMYQYKAEVLQSSCENPGKVMVYKMVQYQKNNLLMKSK